MDNTTAQFEEIIKDFGGDREEDLRRHLRLFANAVIMDIQNTQNTAVSDLKIALNREPFRRRLGSKKK